MEVQEVAKKQHRDIACIAGILTHYRTAIFGGKRERQEVSGHLSMLHHVTGIATRTVFEIYVMLLLACLPGLSNKQDRSTCQRAKPPRGRGDPLHTLQYAFLLKTVWRCRADWQALETPSRNLSPQSRILYGVCSSSFLLPVEYGPWAVTRCEHEAPQTLRLKLCPKKSCPKVMPKPKP